MKRTIYSPFSSAVAGSTKPVFTESELLGIAEEAAQNLDDGIISKYEKSTSFINSIERLLEAYNYLVAAGAQVGLSTADITLNRNNLVNYLNSLTPAWNDVSQETAVNRVLLNSYLKILAISLSTFQELILIETLDLIELADAAAAQAAVDAINANNSIANITNDNILSGDEKPEIRKQRDAIVSEYPVIRARAVALGRAIASYDSVYTALIAYLAGLDVNNSTNTAIDRATFNAYFTQYYGQRQVVLDGISEEAAKRASNLPLGNSNRVPFSRMEGGRGWSSGGDVAKQPTPVLFDGRHYIVSRPVVFTTAGQSNYLFSDPTFPVIPGERLSVSSFVQAFPESGPNPSFWQLYIEYLNASGTIISNVQIGTGSTGVSEGAGRVSGFANVPNNARSARLVMQAISAGAGSMQVGILEPMITSAAEVQTVHPPFSPGPNASDGATVGAPNGTFVGSVPAEFLVAEAALARSDSQAALAEIASISNDNILSKDEKPDIRKQREEAAIEYPTIRARAANLGISVTNYDSVYTALIVYLAGLDLNGATNTTINRDTFNSYFTQYYTQRQLVLDGIADEASKRASSLPLGNANRVPFSRMEGNRGWAALFNGSALSGATGYGTFENRRFFFADITATAPGQTFSIGGVTPIRVTPLERLSVQAKLDVFNPAAEGGSWTLRAVFLNAGGSPTFVPIGAAAGTTNASIIVSNFIQVPVGQVSMTLELVAVSGASGAWRIAISEPMVTGASPVQTVHPAFTPGPNSTDGADPNGLITVDGSGIISGIGTANIVVDNSKLPLGTNALVNSEFTRGKFGWNWRSGGFEADWGVNRPGWFGQRNVMWAFSGGVLAVNEYRDLCPDAIWNSAGLSKAFQFAMPVVPGERVATSVLAAQHRCVFQLYILFFDGTGTLVGAPATQGGTPGGGANGDPLNFTLLTEIANVPANARWAIPMMRMVGTGENDPYIFFTEPMISKVAAGQTVAPRYNPGRADSLADETATAQRSIEADYPVIEIRHGEAGHTGSRTVNHIVKRGTSIISGGTWSIVSNNLGSASVSVNSSTGVVTLSGITQSGGYTIRYVHTDGVPTETSINVTYMPASSVGPTGVVLNDLKVTSIAGSSAAACNYSLTSSGAINASFKSVGAWINPQTGMADYEVRATLRSGSIVSGPLNSWLNLGVTRTWSNTRTTAGFNQGEILVQIRRVSDQTIVAMAIIELYAEREI